jgi:hypothetical protein
MSSFSRIVHIMDSHKDKIIECDTRAHNETPLSQQAATPGKRPVD